MISRDQEADVNNQFTNQLYDNQEPVTTSQEHVTLKTFGKSDGPGPQEEDEDSSGHGSESPRQPDQDYSDDDDDEEESEAQTQSLTGSDRRRGTQADGAHTNPVIISVYLFLYTQMH